MSVIHNLKIFFKKRSSTIILISLVVLFFSFSIILTYDSGHYLGYVSIFENESAASSWDIVRGPVFPLIIHLSNILFGKTSTGILICTFLFYLSFVLICHIICKEIFKKFKHKKLFHGLLLAYLIINPLILGYYHVLLTEFVSITITMLNILLAYKWIFVDLKNKKQLLLYSIYFIFITVFCWHLKQPYIIIAVIPTIVAGVLSIIQNHKKNNLIYRFGTIFLSIIILAFSIFSWNIVLDAMHANKNTARDSSSILSKQLAITYQISDTNDNYFSAFTNEVLRNPGKIIGIYLSNYCSLASLCKIESTDGVNYHSTSELDLLNTYENTAIGYATYNRTENIFQMSDDMHNRAADYATNVSSNVFRPFMKVLSNPTNIIFKLAILFCIPITIFLIIVKVKTHDKKHQSLFYLTFILLSTASFHLIFSAIALVIDRYAIEAFTPICLGFFGTIAYAKLAIKSKQNPKLLKTQPKEKHA